MIIIKEPTERNPYRHFFYEDSKGREWKYRVCSDLGAELERLYKKTYTGKSCFIVWLFVRKTARKSIIKMRTYFQIIYVLQGWGR